MVKHDWIEHQLIRIEHARNQANWSEHHDKQFKYLLNLYDTGRFTRLSKKQIEHHLSSLVQ